MRAFTQTLQTTPATAAARSAIPAATQLGHSLAVSAAASHCAHDFGRLPLRPPAPPIQTNLAINKPGDAYEQEADLVSERVMRMAEPQIQRPCACGATCAKCQTQQPDPAHECVQTKRIPSIDSGHGAAPPIVRGVLAASGQPLALATRRFMEPRFGHDFGRVRVHTDRVAADSAESIGARAYTAGHHVVFGAGQYRLSTADGRRL